MWAIRFWKWLKKVLRSQEYEKKCMILGTVLFFSKLRTVLTKWILPPVRHTLASNLRPFFSDAANHTLCACSELPVIPGGLPTRFEAKQNYWSSICRMSLPFCNVSLPSWSKSEGAVIRKPQSISVFASGHISKGKASVFVISSNEKKS